MLLELELFVQFSPSQLWLCDIMEASDEHLNAI